jgi:hypothetical protein
MAEQICIHTKTGIICYTNGKVRFRTLLLPGGWQPAQTPRDATLDDYKDKMAAELSLDHAAAPKKHITRLALLLHHAGRSGIDLDNWHTITRHAWREKPARKARQRPKKKK